MNNKAFERAKSAYGTGAYDDATMEFIFPQLRESEDERIRKEIIEVLRFVPSSMWEQAKTNYERCFSYLEKQKERKHYWKPTETDVALFNKAVTTNKTLTPTERAQLDIIRSKFGCCRATTCNGIVQKEQKPVDFPTTDEEVKEFLETHPKVEVPEKYKTPDFVFSKQEYESHPIISKDTTSVKSAEWSEEDEEKLKAICTYLRDYSRLVKLGDKLRFNEYCDFLESLRPQGSKDSLQTHWKPSEEQMTYLNECVIEARERHRASTSGYERYRILDSLYNDLKKL